MGNLQDVINRLSSMDMNQLESMENNQNFISVAPKSISMMPRSASVAAPLATPVNSFRAPLSAATFDILIERESFNIPNTLPVVLFGALDRESDYVDIISPELASGITYTIAKTDDNKGLKFTFTKTLVENPDVVTIRCNETPYLNLLRASQGSIFKMQQNKLLISDVAFQSQFSQKVQVVNRSMFGKNTYDTFTPNQYKSDLQNQNDIRTIDAIIDIDMQRSLLMNVAYKADYDSSFLVTLTSFIQKFEKPTASERF